MSNLLFNWMVSIMSDLRSQTCCFTGHRRLPAERLGWISARLDAEVERLIGEGIRCFAAGGALGFDTLAALSVLRMREKYPEIQLILVLPCAGQTRGWPAADRARYERIRALADKVVLLAGEYDSSCMLRRNLYLVQHSSVCVCYLARDRSGAGQTVRRAREDGVTVVNLV